MLLFLVMYITLVSSLCEVMLRSHFTNQILTPLIENHSIDSIPDVTNAHLW